MKKEELIKHFENQFSFWQDVRKKRFLKDSEINDFQVIGDILNCLKGYGSNEGIEKFCQLMLEKK